MTDDSRQSTVDRKQGKFSSVVCLLSSVVLILQASPLSAGSCYSQEEFEAARGLRMHSDMEVITLTCKYGSYSKPLQPAYARFTHKYAKVLRGWESVIARAHPELGNNRNEVIDNFRTALANNKSNEAARLSPRRFCIVWANFVLEASTWKMPQILAYIRQQDSTRPTLRPPC